MKRKTSRLLALASLLGLLSFGSIAHANNYSGNCADFPNISGGGTFDGNGTVTISDGACTLPQNITATGAISISATSVAGGKNLTSSGAAVTVTASGGNAVVGTVSSYLNTQLSGNNVTAGAITSGWGVKVTGNNGNLTLSTIISNSGNSSNGGNVLLSATGNIKTGNIKNSGTTTAGGIEIHANTNKPAPSVFVIGGTASNGSGILDVSNTSGGGSSPGYMPAGIYVTNGNSSSTGGITVSSMDKLVLTSQTGRAGLLILDAKGGTLTLPTGTLNANGAPGFGAGSIYLLANTVSTASGTIVSASQSTAAPATYHYANIAAASITTNGTGLTLAADGHGVSYATASAGIMPKGAIAVSSNANLNSLSWTVTVNAFTTTGPLSVSGSGPIKITSNGDNSRTQVSGSTITFSNNGNVTLESKGASSHEVLVSGPSPTDITFSGTGAVVFDSTATPAGNGGDINVYTRKFTMDKTSIAFRADGPTSGTSNGNGGKIYVSTDNAAGQGFVLNAAATASFSANAAIGGTGNALYSAPDSGQPRAITLWAGSRPVNLGSAAGQFTFSANGGQTGGDAGSIAIAASEHQLKAANAVTAKGLAADGKGGSFESYAVISSVDNIANPFVDLSGFGSGTGGKLQIFHFLANFDVNKYFKVDGGNTLLNAAENDFGRIKINNTTCQQRTTGKAPWPKTYWNCQHPDASTSVDKRLYVNNTLGVDAGASLLHGTMKAALGAANIQIYIMRDPNAFKEFHGVGPANVDGVYGYSYEGMKVSSVFFQMLKGANPPDTTINSLYSGVVIHEMAHQLNRWSWANIDLTGPNWLNIVNTESTNFNAGTCSTVVDADRTFVGRNAICSKFDGVTINPNTGMPYPFKPNLNGLAVDGEESWVLASDERFANAFAASYARTYPATQVTVDAYITRVVNRFTTEHAYMDAIRTTGAPSATP